LLFLRARYYEPGTGRFISRDPWQGTIWQPSTLFRSYVYVRNNPVNLNDPSGFADCSTWPSPIKWMCEQANAGDLDTIESLYNSIVVFAYARGGDKKLAGGMLFHYLHGNGNDLNLSWWWSRRIGEDANIVDATNDLLTGFIVNDVKPVSPGTEAVAVGPTLFRGLDFYTWDERPRPQSDGLYGATGHFAFNATIRGEVQLLCESGKYLVKFVADCSVDDSERYEWIKDTETDFGNLFGTGHIRVPHNWTIALRDATPPRAHEYKWSATWRDKGRLLVESDWSAWRRLQWWELPH
jgi:hypothetical protein